MNFIFWVFALTLPIAPLQASQINQFIGSWKFVGTQKEPVCPTEVKISWKGQRCMVLDSKRDKFEICREINIQGSKNMGKGSKTYVSHYFPQLIGGNVIAAAHTWTPEDESWLGVGIKVWTVQNNILYLEKAGTTLRADEDIDSVKAQTATYRIGKGRSLHNWHSKCAYRLVL